MSSVYGEKTTGSVLGLAVRANIEGFSAKDGTIDATLISSGRKVKVKLPAGWIGNKGQISGGFPEKGTTIFVVPGQGYEYVFVAYDQPDARRQKWEGDGTRRVSALSKLRKGRWLTLVEKDVNLIVDPSDGVVQGGSVYFTQADPNIGIWSSRFPNEMHFTDAHREVIGPVRRDQKPNNSRDAAGSSLYGHRYQTTLTEIGLDPRSGASISNAGIRNPTLVEARSMYYEFANSFGYTNDENEERLYGGEDLPKPKPYQRKRSRTDTMSLSLDHPNYLAEIIIGTVVDIYGNILDINRSVLPSGLIDSLSFRKSEEDSSLVFRKLREQLRRSIAYHFELNARKENVDESVNAGRDFPGIFIPDYTNRKDYARSRSRFFFDIDKEGQFKMNVPASSEVGNVPVLVRHENFSNIKGAEQDVDRGQFLRNKTNNTDVKLEPHGKGVIDLVSNEETLKSYSAPVNRFDGKRIKLGTGFHEISGILELHKFDEPYSDKGSGGYPDSLLNFIDPVEDVVSSEIIVAGEDANAGGRSGTISLDGMLSVSIGANTVDRQSLWLDCAGGIVGTIGRDRWQRSVAATLDGDVLLQVGGATITDDSRFPSVEFNNSARDGVIDIRVWNSGSFHTIRIDNQGIKFHTPQRIDIVSEGEMRFKSVRANMYFDAEGIFMYSGSSSRYVLRSEEVGNVDDDGNLSPAQGRTI